VWDGNTVLIEGGFSIRYLGVSTPGGGMFNRPVEPFGREAAERNVALVEGQMVEIEQDVSDVDGNGFLLRYVYVNGEMVNEVLLREGLARLDGLGQNVRHEVQLAIAEATARSVPANIWTLPTPTPTPTTTPTPQPMPTAQPEGPAAPLAPSTANGRTNLSAIPNPVPAGSGRGTTTVTWDTGDGSFGQVYVWQPGGNEVLFGQGAQGSAEASWIERRYVYEFRLYRGASRERLATLTVTGI
jgi:hypothetical protein